MSRRRQRKQTKGRRSNRREGPTKTAFPKKHNKSKKLQKDPAKPVSLGPLTELEILAHGQLVHAELLTRSPRLDAANFTVLGAAHLRALFDGYDRRFFDGNLSTTLKEARARLMFRVSNRMTRNAGKLTVFRGTFPQRAEPGTFAAGVEGPPRQLFELAISSTLLFASFADVDRPIQVNGRTCANRLEALQRIVEHELVHLLEHLTSGRSSCKAAPFRAMALSFFGHTDVTHRLVTGHERARERFNIGVGDRVTFGWEGQTLAGTVNRITKRATVLVPGDEGQLYSDGKRYLKYYVPLPMLSPTG